MSYMICDKGFRTFVSLGEMTHMGRNRGTFNQDLDQQGNC